MHVLTFICVLYQYGLCVVVVIICSSFLYVCFCVFFFKQKTAYEMRISDWSSDVCSSDLNAETGDCGQPATGLALGVQAMNCRSSTAISLLIAMICPHRLWRATAHRLLGRAIHAQLGSRVGGHASFERRAHILSL